MLRPRPRLGTSHLLVLLTLGALASALAGSATAAPPRNSRGGQAAQPPARVLPSWVLADGSHPCATGVCDAAGLPLPVGGPTGLFGAPDPVGTTPEQLRHWYGEPPPRSLQ